jgi:hypothetical protein
MWWAAIYLGEIIDLRACVGSDTNIDIVHYDITPSWGGTAGRKEIGS